MSKGKGGIAPPWKWLGRPPAQLQMSGASHSPPLTSCKPGLLPQSPGTLVPTSAIQSRTSRGQTHLTFPPSQVIWSRSAISGRTLLQPGLILGSVQLSV